MKRVERLGIMRQGLKVATSRVDIDDSVVDEFAETGKLTIGEVLPDDAFAVLRGACSKLFDRRLPVTRKIDNPKWHNVDKVTLFRNPEAFKQSVHAMVLYAPELFVTSVWTDNTIRCLSGKLMDRVGSPGALLFGYRSERAIVNRMNGSQEDPAILGLHIDPKPEHGANASITLDQGVDLITGKDTLANTLNIYACEDLSGALGIEQLPHGYSADSTRFSVVFTKFLQ